jgi:hypothetical protein
MRKEFAHPCDQRTVAVAWPDERQRERPRRLAQHGDRDLRQSRYGGDAVAQRALLRLRAMARTISKPPIITASDISVVIVPSA